MDGIQFNWTDEISPGLHIIYLSDYMKERKLNYKIFQHIQPKYDFVFATNYGYVTELAAIFYMHWKKIPYILEIDGAIAPKRESFFKYWIKKQVISNANALFSPSENTDKILCKYGANRKKIVHYPFTSLTDDDIYPDISSVTEKYTLRKELGIDSQWMVLAVGQFIPRKGFDTLLSAACTLQKEIGFVFVGGEPPKEYIEIIKQNNLSNIYFRCYQTAENLKKYYRAADVFCLPTRKDIWGLVINEAMACGLPIITTTQCEAGNELLKQQGILIEPENISALSEAIQSCLYNETKRIEMAQNSLKIIRRFTIKKMVEVHCKFMGISKVTCV